MTFEPSNAISQSLPQDLVIPDDYEELKRFLDGFFRKLTDSINKKDIGVYGVTERVNGQSYFASGNPQRFRSVYRKVIDMGALPDNTTLSVAHNIDTTQDFVFVRIYGCATNPDATEISQAIPLPYIDMSGPANHIQLDIDSNNVNITTDADYTDFTTCYVVVEYTKY